MTRNAVDPRARALKAWLDLIGWPMVPHRSVAQARRDLRVVAAAGGRVERVAEVRDETIQGPHGLIRIRIYTPHAGSKPRPILVWFHGGGFVCGDLFTAENTCRALANRSGAVVVSVAYRLAPEHAPAASFQDCMAATAWASEHAGQIGGDQQRLAVGGESSGGTLAALVALACRGTQGPSPRFQLLVYPVVDFHHREPFRNESAHRGLVAYDAMAWFHRRLVESGAGIVDLDANDPTLSALDADLSGSPPALVITAGCDPLRDDAEAFAARLRDAGTPVEVARFPGQVHGFFTMERLFPAGGKALDLAGAALARAFDMSDGAKDPRAAFGRSIVRGSYAMGVGYGTILGTPVSRLKRLAAATLSSMWPTSPPTIEHLDGSETRPT